MARRPVLPHELEPSPEDFQRKLVDLVEGVAGHSGEESACEVVGVS
jgi:hypothetical protein